MENEHMEKIDASMKTFEQKWLDGILPDEEFYVAVSLLLSDASEDEQKIIKERAIARIDEYQKEIV